MAEREKKKQSAQKTFWQREATGVLQSLLARHHVSYKALSMQLERIGVKLSDRAVCNKINRGTFSAVFFLQCVHALGYKEVRFDLSPMPQKEAAKAGARRSV